MRRILIFLLIGLLLGALVITPKEAKAEDTNWWVKEYAGNDWDKVEAVVIADNGDIVVVSSTTSFGTGTPDYSNVWVLRLDTNGNVKWQKTYGGNNDDYASAVAIAPNGDIIVVGYTESFGAGQRDVWVLRLDSNGNVKWQKTYGGEGWDLAYAVAIAENGDIIVAGETNSFGVGHGDIWVLRLDENGNVKWQKTYGLNDVDHAYAIAIAPNEDIIITGTLTMKIDTNGNVIWAKDVSGDGVAVAPDGDIVITGTLTMKIDTNGNVIWAKDVSGYAVTLAPNGDIIVAGGNLVRLSPDGELKWAVRLIGYDIEVLPDGTAVLVGNEGVPDFLVAQFNVDEVPNYSGWGGWNKVSLEVNESNTEVHTINVIVGTSNAVMTNTNAEIYDTNTEVEIWWTYTPSSALRIYGHDVNIQEKIIEEQAEETVENETAIVNYQAITEVYNVTVKVDGEEKPGYLVRHNLTIIDVEGEVEAFRTIFNVSKEVAYSVDDMILPPDAIIINPEPVIALDIKDPKEGQSVNQTIIILTEVPENEFMQGVKIQHQVITKSNNPENSTCGPGIFLGLAILPLLLRKRKIK